MPLLIIVGVTGVGKSTTLEHLTQLGLTYTLLPDRRVLTDRLIIGAMQVADGQHPGPLQDRALRFAYTRRYRELHPGGMAHALSQLLVDQENAGSLLLFDGLRGDNEVEYAALALPRACFVMLDAPDVVRVQRLLGRRDAFDQIGRQSAQPSAHRAGLSFAALGVPEAGGLFSAAEEQALLALVSRGEVTAEELIAKMQIVVEERRNYDPAATRAALLRYAAGRALIVDTTQHQAPAVARLIAEQCQRWGVGQV